MRASKVLKNQSGMTLIEIMIVLAIVVGLMTTVGSNVISQFQGSKVKQTRIKMGEVANAIEMYALDCGDYPSNEAGLGALMNAPSNCPQWGPTPYVKKKASLQDAWNRDFLYERLSSSEFEILSFGADGQEGGEGLDMDISNLDGSEEEE